MIYPQYPFREVVDGETVGEVVYFEYPMMKAPGIGKRVRRKGKTYQRVITKNPEIHVDSFLDEPLVSRQLPRNYEPHRLAGGKFNKRGNPVFESKRQVEATEKMARDFSAEDDIRHPAMRPFRSRT